MEIQDLSLGLSVVYNSLTKSVCRCIGYFPGFHGLTRLTVWKGKEFGDIQEAPFYKLLPIPLNRSLLEALGFKEIINQKNEIKSIEKIYTNTFVKNFDLDGNINYPFYGIFNELYIDLNCKAIILKENRQDIISSKQTILWENPKEELYLHFLQKIVWDYFKTDLFKNVNISKEILTQLFLNDYF